MPQLAQALQLKSKSAVNQVEKGHNLPTLSRLVDIAEYFGVTTDYLLGLSDSPQVQLNHTEELQALQQQVATLQEEVSYKTIIREVQMPCTECAKLKKKIASLEQKAKKNQFVVSESPFSENKCIKTAANGYHLFIGNQKFSVTCDDFFSTIKVGMLETITLLIEKLQSPPHDPHANQRLKELADALRIFADKIDETLEKS